MERIKNNLLFTLSCILVITVIASLTFFAVAKAEQNYGRNHEIGENNAGTVKNATSEDEDEDENEFDADEHLNKVKDFKHELLNIADREEDEEEKEEIKDIADEQDESASTTARAIEKIEHRNKIVTFLFGSDYKNLGALRSEIVKTRNRLDQLDRLAERIQNATDTAEIQSQIQNLEQEMIKIENFIKAQEGKFSLFGWLVKMFQ